MRRNPFDERKALKTSQLSFVTILIAAAIVVGVKLPHVLLAAPQSKAAASDESALLKDFAQIGPIEAHIHIYKNDPALNVCGSSSTSVRVSGRVVR